MFALVHAQAEATRLVAALQRRAEQQEGGLLAAADIFSIADEIDLQVENVRILIEELNEGGELWPVLLPERRIPLLFLS
jgi:hypothetical protein